LVLKTEQVYSGVPVQVDVDVPVEQPGQSVELQVPQ
jgi:hypothetical protein